MEKHGTITSMLQGGIYITQPVGKTDLSVDIIKYFIAIVHQILAIEAPFRICAWIQILAIERIGNAWTLLDSHPLASSAFPKSDDNVT